MAPSFIRLMLEERLASEAQERRPEPEAVMDEAEQVAAYTEAGRDAAIMAPTHLFHSVHACEVIRPGDRVLDLGCGPGTQLVQLAELNPDVEFVGVDLAERMLEEARAFARQRGASNVRFERADMTDLRGGVSGRVAKWPSGQVGGEATEPSSHRATEGGTGAELSPDGPAAPLSTGPLDHSATRPLSPHYPDASFDAVVSSMTLHHLPEEGMLAQCLAEVARVLKPGGGLYLADFARLRTSRSMHFFAHQYADDQSPAFTRDYWNSLQAAFSAEQMAAAAAPLGDRARLYRMRLLGMMLALKSPARRQLDAGLRGRLRERVEQLPPRARRDFKRIAGLFRLAGMRMPKLGG